MYRLNLIAVSALLLATVSLPNFVLPPTYGQESAAVSGGADINIEDPSSEPPTPGGEETGEPAEPDVTAEESAASDPDGADVTDGTGIEPKVSEVIGQAQEKVSELAEGVDKSEKANEAKASVLKPIYTLAEKLSFPAFYWLAFMLMVTGCVSFVLQLVLGKLIALTKLGFSITEILSDALGLVISLFGLVLTTQAATENSTFTQSAFAVLSATILGLVLGCIFYVWGQRQELQAIDARKARAAAED